MASGAIKGISQGDVVRFQVPQIELLLNDLYPSSRSYLLLFEGATTTGTVVTSYPMERESSESHVLAVTGLDSKINKGRHLHPRARQ